MCVHLHLRRSGVISYSTLKSFRVISTPIISCTTERTISDRIHPCDTTPKLPALSMYRKREHFAAARGGNTFQDIFRTSGFDPRLGSYICILPLRTRAHTRMHIATADDEPGIRARARSRGHERKKKNKSSAVYMSPFLSRVVHGQRKSHTRGCTRHSCSFPRYRGGDGRALIGTIHDEMFRSLSPFSGSSVPEKARRRQSETACLMKSPSPSRVIYLSRAFQPLSRSISCLDDLRSRQLAAACTFARARRTVALESRNHHLAPHNP